MSTEINAASAESLKAMIAAAITKASGGTIDSAQAARIANEAFTLAIASLQGPATGPNFTAMAGSVDIAFPIASIQAAVQSAVPTAITNEMGPNSFTNIATAAATAVREANDQQKMKMKEVDKATPAVTSQTEENKENHRPAHPIPASMYKMPANDMSETLRYGMLTVRNLIGSPPISDVKGPGSPATTPNKPGQVKALG
ncbi:MAG: hypothetical protein ACHP6I_00180 [Rickettsiales bacterium]